MASAKGFFPWLQPRGFSRGFSQGLFFPRLLPRGFSHGFSAMEADSMCTGATSGDESHPGPPSDQGGELPWIPVCESCEVELDSPADRVMVHGMWLCTKKCGSNYTYLCKTARAGGYNDSLEEFKNKQPKEFQC